MIEPKDFFDLSDPLADELFTGCDFIWDVLPKLKKLTELFTGGKSDIRGEIRPGAYVSERANFISESAVIHPGAYILGPAYIGPGVEVRHGAFVRENVIMLEGSLLGHASEAKNSLLMARAHAPHFNYLGDSVLGMGTNLGAGTKLSNLTILSLKDPETGKRPTVKIFIDGEEFDTGLAKIGAILGDGVQTGCNSVLNPGCLVGPHTLIYPNVNLKKGFTPAGRIIKLRQHIEDDQRLV
ncbi:MAG: glucose-1-phosphate thymidylyltransferase [Anaerolineae bacterium]|nr:MAG: glucose-1-phosphate thymidylyltransferase [Anaerolineae bacterium]